MKAKIFLPLFILFFSTKIVAQTSVEETLKKRIKTIQEAAANKDWATWESGWIHDEKVRFANVGSTFLYTVNGWDKFKMAMEDSANNNGPKPKSFNIKNDNFNIRVAENIAWADFDQEVTVTDTAQHQYFSHVACLLVKEGEDWKFASRTNFYSKTYNSSDPADIENSLNTTGYNLVNGKRLDQAIDVFKLNVKLHPKAWNTYDSLGEAYALAGDKNLAIENYKRSIELNPENDNGKKALEKLMKK